MLEADIVELQRLLPQCLLPDWLRLGRRLGRLVRDRHHPAQRDALLARLLDQVHASIALREQRRLRVPRPSYPPDLPITARKDEIVAALRAHQVIVIAGETGSGKTTQLPKLCLEAGLGIEAKIGCTQPRRVAALSISRRVAEELNAGWGREVGCKIRFDDRSGAETYIKFMTDGILLAEMQGDPDFSEYNAIIIDEAHERSLNIDFLLGHLKGLLARRHDLKLIITSATIDTQVFARHFNNAPIIEVSGRLYPVEVQYHPLDSASEERGDTSYVDAAVAVTERILCETNVGDILIFMPGERDIRETADQLEGRFAGEAEVVPLFGRLSGGEQQRVFAPSARRKIVIATNIAETSLTIPGIRYVIDSGLARLSRYNPRTRIKRLPIEPISQSSANQRNGRAGRVQAGVCIRLFAEEDFAARPAFTPPEIQRANLAEVILRMKAFHLGDIETFPFVQPPAPGAIANGYALLQELGALDAERHLTPLGEDLARLPIDPTLGRMLLQSQREHAPQELLIIAAGLSIQDPRERPLDQKEAAAAAHRKFTDPQSDFLSLLHLWRGVHEEWERLRTQGQRRKFCRQHFLSYLRMREWQDVYAQLHDALDDLGTLKFNESNASYDAIHRSILAGLIGHTARFEERNTYKAAGNRLLSVFPGSALHVRGEPVKKFAKGAKPPPKPKSTQPAWIVAGEIVETSQLFARTLAGIDPQWIYQLAPHCCKVTQQNPRWHASAGNVLIEEIITLHGLEIQRRKVAYGNFNPAEATAIFIRAALVEEDLLPAQRAARETTDEEDDDLRTLTTAVRELPPAYQFLAYNRAVREKIENWRTRVRHHHARDPDETLAAFYARHLTNVSSLHELNRFLQEPGAQQRLRITEEELAGGQSLQFDTEAFPNSVSVGGQPLAVGYAYAPGEAHDGVTIEVPFSMAQTASSALLEWAVPGLRAEMIAELLRALPKTLRKELMPFPPKIAEIVRDFQPTGGAFLPELAAFLRHRYCVDVKPDSWPAEALPAHLRPRIAIIDHDKKTVAAGRDFAALQSRLQQNTPAPAPQIESAEWRRATQQWERFGLRDWTIGSLPERVTVREVGALPEYAWPGLELAEGEVNVHLFRSPEQARAATLPGMRRIVELAVQKDLAWLEKDLRGLNRFDALYAPLGDSAELRETALEHLKRHVLPEEIWPELTRTHFDQAVAAARERLPGLATRFMDQLGPILQLRQQAQQRFGAALAAAPRRQTLSSLSQLGAAPPTVKHPLAGELESLFPPRFLEKVSWTRLPHYVRYLKALLLRAERAALNPVKDKERQALLAPYVTAWRALAAQPARSPAVEAYRWLLEEYKVSLFAQELGTAVPVSPPRLDRQLEAARGSYFPPGAGK
ncbi:MAG TPA: ATP-dependent RNA helicase HrpA [Verrucomicrobiae bacterium]|nr:ATP-dependent RNA helicase HrpA [Verrucomicrobiae bacterium]